MPKPSNDQKALPEERIKTAAEIYRALGPLAKKADAAGLTFLAYLLAVAAHHAEDVVTHTDKQPREQNPQGSSSQPFGSRRTARN